MIRSATDGGRCGCFDRRLPVVDRITKIRLNFYDRFKIGPGEKEETKKELSVALPTS